MKGAIYMETVKVEWKKVFRGETVIPDKEKYSYICISLAVIHMCITIMFLIMRVYPLMLYNILSVILYLCLNVFVGKNKMQIVFNCAYIEICFHTYLVTVLTGWKLGFQLYTLALIPVSFYVAYTLNQMKYKVLYPLIYALVSTVVFLSTRIYYYVYPDIYIGYNTGYEPFCFLFNSIVAFAMLMLFSMLYLLEINVSVNKYKAALEEVSRIANIDSLTGLITRRKMMEHLKMAYDNEKNYSIIICDIDDFKSVNDTYGHNCGDQILINTTAIFKSIESDNNIVCRWGGEEILILSFDNRDKVLATAEYLRKTVEENVTIYNNKEVSVTITMGVARVMPGEVVDDTIIRADEKLYKGKSNGKNCIIK